MNAKELEKYIPFLKSELEGHYLNRLSPYAKGVFFLSVSSSPFKRLAIVLESQNPRLYLAKEEKSGKGRETPFVAQLRKLLGNAYVKEVSQLNGDRVVSILYSSVNEVYKEVERELIIELIPRRSNLLILDGNRKILLSYRTGSLSDKRPLVKNCSYEPLPLNSFVSEDADFSLSRYLDSCLEGERELERELKEARYGKVIKSIKSRKAALTRKIGKIQKDIDEAKTHKDDGRYGDLIYTFYETIGNGDRQFEVEGETIALDPLKSRSQNAENYYKRGKKAKLAIERGQENIEKAKKELADIELTLDFLSAASEEGLEKMERELGLLEVHPNRKAKTQINLSACPYMVTYRGTRISFGRNAKQNDCLSFLFPVSRNHVWLHIEGGSGSHVVIRKENPEGPLLEMGAMLALLLSKREDGNVMVALKKDVRKGHVPGEAVVREHRSLHVRKVTEEAKALLETATKELPRRNDEINR